MPTSEQLRLRGLRSSHTAQRRAAMTSVPVTAPLAPNPADQRAILTHSTFKGASPPTSHHAP